VADFRVADPSFLAGAVTRLAFLVDFRFSIKLFFFITILPQRWIREKSKEADPTAASPDSELICPLFYCPRYLALFVLALTARTAIFRLVPPSFLAGVVMTLTLLVVLSMLIRLFFSTEFAPRSLDSTASVEY